ncbi:hypothetical protein PENTCL1PPCAC_27859, partial [Pristionchus entomophagus]
TVVSIACVPQHSLQVRPSLLRQLHVVQIIGSVPSGSQIARGIELGRNAFLSLFLILVLLHIFQLWVQLLALRHLLVDYVHCTHITGDESENELISLTLLLSSLLITSSRLQLLMSQLHICNRRGLLLRVQGDVATVAAAGCSAGINDDEDMLVGEGGDIRGDGVHDDGGIGEGETTGLSTRDPCHRVLCHGERALSGDGRVVEVGDHLLLDESDSLLRNGHITEHEHLKRLMGLNV